MRGAVFDRCSMKVLTDAPCVRLQVRTKVSKAMGEPELQHAAGGVGVNETV